ncbi:sigma-70 family RNA polymerase sigma factor [Photobacterium sp. J15]|uniref:sigma-70 family RNA polymerase sigma factor n=1 Tax=Photobacterium sp. J15 TaxID=265901 RepID=UPI0007E2FC69|nr:sigma-70 family RNA polymerase sigma factor [Photobacterium sp. J15]
MSTIESADSVHHSAAPCLMRAWQAHQHSLLSWLYKHTDDDALAEDLLHEVFLRAMRKNKAFCDIDNAKAWLFRVANNLVIDQSRQRSFVPLDDLDFESEQQEIGVVDSLTQCLPRVLNELAPKDSDILKACDIHGMTQKEYAELHGMTLVATKSRLQRARQKLKRQLSQSCKVKLDEYHKVCCFTPRESKN